MKRFLRFLLKHFSTTLTLLVTIGTAIVVNCMPSISVGFLDNFLMVSIIALNLTFLFDFTRNLDETKNEIEEFKHILPPSRIESFDTVDEVAEQLTAMVSEGNHDVDIVLYDIKIRTTDPQKVSKMQGFIKYCSNNKRIKLRLAFVPSPDSICERIENILEAEKTQSNSFYAYQVSQITFASFMVIDNSFVSIRTPHKNGSKSLYCVVKEETLCTLYSSWFSILWEEANHVNALSLSGFIDQYKELIPENKYKVFKKSVEALIK